MSSPIPGGTLLATYSANPDWRQQKVLGLAQALGGAMNSHRARKEQEEAREREEIATFYEMAMRNSEIAATQGDWFKKKYGAKYPQVNALVDFLAKGEAERRAEAERIRGAEQMYYSTQQQIEGGFQQERDAVAAMPDEVPVEVPVPSIAGFGGQGHVGSIVLPMPNAEKAVRSTQLSQVPEWASSAMAVARLTPEQRAILRAAKKLPFDEFNPFGDDVPVDDRPLYQAAIEGRIPIGDITTANRARSGLQQKPAEIEKQEYETAERKAKHGESMALESHKSKLTAANQAATDARAMARELVRQGGKGGGGRGRAKADEALWKLATADSEKRLSEWQEGLNAALSGLPRAPKKGETQAAIDAAIAKKRSEYVAANGPPVRLSVTNAERIQAKVRSMGLAPEDEKIETAKMVEEFSRLMRVPRTTIDDAMKIVLNRNEPTQMPSSLRKLIEDSAARAAGGRGGEGWGQIVETAKERAAAQRESGKSWTEIERLMRQAGAQEDEE